VRTCPNCGKRVEWQGNPWRPFCSERCKLIDFGRWTDEEYRVPGQGINASEIAEPTQADELADTEDSAAVNGES